MSSYNPAAADATLGVVGNKNQKRILPVN